MRNLLTSALILAGIANVATASPIVFRFGADPNQFYRGEDVGPYSAQLTHSLGTSFFCLDADLDSTFGARYTGTITRPNDEQTSEAAFLANYEMLQAQNNVYSDPIAQLYGPTSFAIWQIMGTLGSDTPDPAAQALVTMAKNAFNNGLITASFLSNVQIFNPADPTIQRFITVQSAPTILNSLPLLFVQSQSAATPEPASLALVGGALVVLLIRRKLA
jgi:hypothetical protein